MTLQPVTFCYGWNGHSDDLISMTIHPYGPYKWNAIIAQCTSTSSTHLDFSFDLSPLPPAPFVPLTLDGRWRSAHGVIGASGGTGGSCSLTGLGLSGTLGSWGRQILNVTCIKPTYTGWGIWSDTFGGWTNVCIDLPFKSFAILPIFAWTYWIRAWKAWLVDTS